MSGQLLGAGDGPVVRCALCGKPASGPCARCRSSVCADCCVLTEGASPFAVCLRCARAGGATLRREWRALAAWLALVLLALVAIAAALAFVV